MPPPKIKEEERIERIIRGLLKLPENKRCINCNSLGPQYVCTTFWTFVCTSCSGVHREFTHRVKSVSMAKFSADEVAALQAGGNEQARKTYFTTWNPQRNSFPDSSNLYRLREFIRHVYVEGRYSGERNNDKVSLNTVGAKDDYLAQRSSENSGHLARGNFFESRTFGRSDQAPRDAYSDQHPFENFSPRVSGRTLRYYIEESSPKCRQEHLKSTSRRRRSVNFEIVDDRFREDGLRSGRQFESNRCPDVDSRARSSSPVSQKGRSKTCPPSVNSVKDILGNGVPPLKLGEPPKANQVKSIECSTQAQKASGTTKPGCADEETKNTVNICNLIDFDADPEPPANAALVQTQQNVLSSDGDNSSASTSTIEKASSAPNLNSMDFLLFDLAGPSVAPSGSTSQHPLGGATPSAATEVSLSTEAAITSGSTTNASSASNYVETTNASSIQNVPAFPHDSSNPVVTVSQALLWPAMNQNQSWFAFPPGNDSSRSLKTSLSVPSLTNQPFLSELAHIEGPPTHISAEHSSQDVSSLEQDTSAGKESVSRGRKELPPDIFTASPSSFAAAVPDWQSRPLCGVGYGMQYHNAATATHDSAKSRNPFDLGDDGLKFQAATFPSMSSLQGSLSNMSASPGPWPQGLPYASADNSQGMSYGMMIPPGVCMGQQLPNNMMPSKPQGINNGLDNADAFASLNPIQHSRGSNPAPSTRENPFG